MARTIRTRTRSPQASAAPGASHGLTSDDVVDAALRIVEGEGADALTMRRLADALGTAVTAIYWHVGNRDELVDRLVGRLIVDMGDVHAAGPTPRARVDGLARELRARLLARPHLIALADQRGMSGAMFQPVQAALATELAAVGITGRRAGQVIQMLQCHVVASVVLARAVGRSPAHGDVETPGWAGGPSDPELVATLNTEPDLDAAFAFGLDALLDKLLDGAAPKGGRPARPKGR